MPETFHEVGSIDYPIIDADAHVNEPPDTWQSRVPARLRNGGPKVLRTDKGDVWSFDDGKRLLRRGDLFVARHGDDQQQHAGQQQHPGTTLFRWRHFAPYNPGNDDKTKKRVGALLKRIEPYPDIFVIDAHQ